MLPDIYPASRSEAHQLLKSLDAPHHLLRHLELVGETAEELVDALSKFKGLEFNRNLVLVGAAIHDAGKIVHPSELSGPGSEHEPAGLKLLEQNGVSKEVARCCVSHAAYASMATSFEEKLVALADKLWKGKREETLENMVINQVASKLYVDKWLLFTELDEAFEEIASKADKRLARSQS